ARGRGLMRRPDARQPRQADGPKQGPVPHRPPEGTDPLRDGPPHHVVGPTRTDPGRPWTAVQGPCSRNQGREAVTHPIRVAIVARHAEVLAAAPLVASRKP